MLADYHVHTYYSDDSTCPMEDMIKRGLELGLNEIAFTEHVDYGVKSGILNCDYAKYFPEIKTLREKYSGRITIRQGIEFGVQLGTIAQFQCDFDKYPFDFVILSNHQIDNREFWNQDYQKGKTQEQIQCGYYQAILDVMHAYKNYSVLGHIDMIKRYDPYGDYPDDKVMDLVDEILKQAIADGKGIEINTSCYHYGLKDITPSRKILRRYLELGGEILTFGSDAHSTKYLADHMTETHAIAKDLGFAKFCTFEKLKPTFHSL